MEALASTEVTFPGRLLGADGMTDVLQLSCLQGLDTLLLQPALQQGAPGVRRQSLQWRAFKSMDGGEEALQAQIHQRVLAVVPRTSPGRGRSRTIR